MAPGLWCASVALACATGEELSLDSLQAALDDASAPDDDDNTMTGGQSASAGSTSSGGMNVTAGATNHDADAGVISNGGNTVTPMGGNGGSTVTPMAGSGGNGGTAAGGTSGSGGVNTGGGGSATAGTSGSGGSGDGGSGGGGPGSCSDLPTWSGATAYGIGAEVVSTCSGVFATVACPEGATHSFRCDAEQIELPWCQQRQPGVTNGWDVIWTDLGVCE